MTFNEHSNLKTSHAFLSPSSYHWLNYEREKLISVYNNRELAEYGTRLHNFAAECIRLKQKLPKNKNTLNMYVNDAIGYRLVPEQVLYFSDLCFGTADAIGFDNGTLRIHDFKSGAVPAHMEQLLIYAALFCLEYHQKPETIQFELRIYQSNDIVEMYPQPCEVREIMDKIIDFDKILQGLKRGER